MESVLGNNEKGKAKVKWRKNMSIKRDHKGLLLGAPFTHGKQTNISKKEKLKENEKDNK